MIKKTGLWMLSILMVGWLGACRPFIPDNDRLEVTGVTSSPQPTLTATLLATHQVFDYTPTSSVTPLPLQRSKLPSQATPTLVAITESLPDLAINFRTKPFLDCTQEDRDQIWIASYPYSQPRRLLANPQTDYRFPVWSPDGNWIAYIESKPSTLWEGASNSDVTGTDSLWIMRPDGSDRHRVSDYFPRADFNSLSMCLPVLFIEGPPVWSPNGKYIVLKHIDLSGTELLASYYILDTESGGTQFLLSQKNDSQPVWLTGSKVVIGDGDKIKVINFDGLNGVGIYSIPHPMNILPTAIFRPIEPYHSRKQNEFLLGSFYQKNMPDQDLSLWQLNLKENTWTKLKDLEATTWGNPKMGNNWVVTCHGKVMNIFDIHTWAIVGSFDAPEEAFMDCSLLDLFQNHDGNDYASFPGAIDKDGDQVLDNSGLWITSLQPRNPDPVLFVIPSPNSGGNFGYSIYYYNWKPAGSNP